MSDLKFLGISIIVAAILIAGSITWLGFSQRYRLQVVTDAGFVYVIDGVTGKIVR